MPLTLHAAWLRVDSSYADGRLFFWAENTDIVVADNPTENGAGHPPDPTSSTSLLLENGRGRAGKVPSHPFQSSVGQVRALLLESYPHLQVDTLQLESATIWLPSHENEPLARRSVLHTQLNDQHQESGSQTAAPELMQWQLTGVTLEPVSALAFLSHLSSQSGRGRTISRPNSWRRLRLGNDVIFWSNASKVALEILAGQHYLPSLNNDASGRFYSTWQTSLLDSRIEKQVAHLIQITPPVCRAYNVAHSGDAPAPGTLVEHFLSSMVDSMIRTWTGEFMPPYSAAAATAWVYGLLTEHRQLALGPQDAYQLHEDWRTWTEQLHVSADANFRICFKLTEPGTNQAEVLDDVELEVEPSNGWDLGYFLQARDNTGLLVSAREVWETVETVLRIGQRRLDRPQERLLAGLSTASKLFAPIGKSLETQRPEGVKLTASEAYQFLREIGPVLEGSGFGLILPDWWNNRRRARLGLRLQLLADEQDQATTWDENPFENQGLSVQYAWELTLGGEQLSRPQFDELAALQMPLIQVNGRWVELDPEQVDAAKTFLQEQPKGTISFLQSLRMAQGTIVGDDGDALPPIFEDESYLGLNGERIADVPAQLPIETVDAEGWLGSVLDQLRDHHGPLDLAEPAGFHGELRPYQRRGIGWLDYLRRLGIGACLADDMGLGKTIQALALLLHLRERNTAAKSDKRVPPALLVCPTSVVANWKHEIDRFAPSLKALTHHGVDRLSGDTFIQAMSHYDMAITSFGTARRDVDLLEHVEWGDLILDEAQNIKNPRAKQTQAVRRIKSHNRIAITGTPVENQLGELWSIMEFLNPGYLGGFERFRKQFVVPIERYNDELRADELRHLVQPFLLRRLKSDPAIIPDLPEKNEMVVYCTLTDEQATLYEQTVQQALAKLDGSSSIQRRGLVLALLTKLKQICNHPAHFLKEKDPLASRSGKLDRLREMLDEALIVGDRALIFTQFVEMGHLLKQHLQTSLETEVLFLHGGTTAKQRDDMVQLFQSDDGPPVFVLSLRAGGSGLNLTNANHVFHFDRWWNPAVEDQATDRAFRIGQKRNVQVHKFVVSGTLEERINEMIESKQALAQAIVGSGEEWLTELNNDQLRDLLSLRRELL